MAKFYLFPMFAVTNHFYLPHVIPVNLNNFTSSRSIPRGLKSRCFLFLQVSLALFFSLLLTSDSSGWCSIVLPSNVFCRSMSLTFVALSFPLSLFIALSCSVQPPYKEVPHLSAIQWSHQRVWPQPCQHRVRRHSNPRCRHIDKGLAIVTVTVVSATIMVT